MVTELASNATSLLETVLRDYGGVLQSPDGLYRVPRRGAPPMYAFLVDAWREGRKRQVLGALRHVTELSARLIHPSSRAEAFRLRAKLTRRTLRGRTLRAKVQAQRDILVKALRYPLRGETAIRVLQELASAHGLLGECRKATRFAWESVRRWRRRYAYARRVGNQRLARRYRWVCPVLSIQLLAHQASEPREVRTVVALLEYVRSRCRPLDAVQVMILEGLEEVLQEKQS